MQNFIPWWGIDFSKFLLLKRFVWIFFLKKDTLSGIFQILLISVTLRRTGMSQKWYSYQRHVPVPHLARDILSKSIKIIIFYKFHAWNEFSDHFTPFIVFLRSMTRFTLLTHYVYRTTFLNIPASLKNSF